MGGAGLIEYTIARACEQFNKKMSDDYALGLELEGMMNLVSFLSFFL